MKAILKWLCKYGVHISVEDKSRCACGKHYHGEQLGASNPDINGERYELHYKVYINHSGIFSYNSNRIHR